MSIFLKTYQTYQRILFRFPIVTEAIQTGLLMGCGDLFAQIFVDRKPFTKIDFVRTGQYAFIGMVVVGPSLRIWYGTLEKYFGKKGKLSTLKKVAADQLLFAPGFLALIMTIVNIVQGSSPLEVTDKLKRDYLDVLKTNYKVWPAVQLCNFYIVPLQYQVITVQVVAIFWNTYFSWKINHNVR